MDAGTALEAGCVEAVAGVLGAEVLGAEVL